MQFPESDIVSTPVSPFNDALMKELLIIFTFDAIWDSYIQ